MIEIAGITKEGKPIVKGIYQFRATFGMPLDYILEMCKDRDIIPDWEHLANEVPLSKMSELRLAIKDVYGHRRTN